MNLAKIYNSSTDDREDAKNLFLADDLLPVIRFQGIKIAFFYGYDYWQVGHVSMDNCTSMCEWDTLIGCSWLLIKIDKDVNHVSMLAYRQRLKNKG